MYWIFHLVELQALGFMDCTFSKSDDEIEPIEELVLDSDAAELEAHLETSEFEPSGLHLEADAGTFEHELGRSC